jgi:CubicO group peptidase (beta-lactamase class C family)
MTKVRNPIGLNGTFFPSGYNNVYVSNARSMARFGLLMLNKGNWNGTQIMTDTTYFHEMVNTSQNLNNAYGYLWWLNGKSSFRVPTLQTVFNGSLHPDAPNDMFSALGKDGQIVNVVPSMNLVFIRMGEAPGTSSEVTFAFNNNIWQKMNAMICNANSTSSAFAESLQVFPNPVGNLLTISAENVEIQAIFMFNINGQLVKQMNNVNANLQNISVAELPQGVYMLQVRTDKGVENRRIVVAK